MQEIVKYHNKFNIPLPGFTAKQMDLLIFICAELKEKGIAVIVIPFSDIVDWLYSSPVSTKKLVRDLDSMCVNLARAISHSELVKKDGKKRIDICSIFNRFTIDETDKTLTVSLNPFFTDIFNNFTNGWTKFNLLEFVGLRSKYSKVLFRYLKERRCLGGAYKVSLEELRQNLDIPASYSTGQIEQKVIQPALDELSGLFDDLIVERDYASTRERGRPSIEGYKFSFRPEKRIRQQDYINNAIMKSGGVLTHYLCPRCGKQLMRRKIKDNKCYCHFDYITGGCNAVYYNVSELIKMPLNQPSTSLNQF